jgi:hypothetical protein
VWYGRIGFGELCCGIRCALFFRPMHGGGSNGQIRTGAYCKSLSIQRMGMGEYGRIGLALRTDSGVVVVDARVGPVVLSVNNMSE